MKTTGTPVKIALFCGGRGSATIIHEMLRYPNIQLTLLVNAYDDGLSTGALRKCISNMLGPSDFRKNLSYLLDLYSEGQYALKSLLELRLTSSQGIIERIKQFSETQKISTLPLFFRKLFGQLSPLLTQRLSHLLNIFFTYEETLDLPFNYDDCSFGNLIFAGAYLDNNYNFNAATKEMSTLVSSRALLLNISTGENRTLVALKDDGELLSTESQIVSAQSSTPIRALFFMDKPIPPLINKTFTEKEQYLRQHESLPEMAPEAVQALEEANIIIFGPGTQHSSLLPSYRIAQQVLQQSQATLKILILNLEPDHDIQGLSSSDIVNNALSYMGDVENHHNVISHIFLDSVKRIPLGALPCYGTYKHAHVIEAEFANTFKKTVHNGRVVLETVLNLWEKHTSKKDSHLFSASIFVDPHRRASAFGELYDELLEIDWQRYFTKITVLINHTNVPNFLPTPLIEFKTTPYKARFPEIHYFFNWLQKEKSEYLILLTGDGKYRLQDIILAIILLGQSPFGAVFGSRNQSRVQFHNALRAAYGEKKILSVLSFLGSFLISGIFALRFGVLFSDPLTGFRIFKRSKISSLQQTLSMHTIKTPISLAMLLIKNNIEIAELPVHYRTFLGFVDPHWRIRRGLASLMSTLKRVPG